MTGLSERWDIESIFAGGSGSPALKQWVEAVRGDLATSRAPSSVTKSSADQAKPRPRLWARCPMQMLGS